MQNLAVYGNFQQNCESTLFVHTLTKDFDVEPNNPVQEITIRNWSHVSSMGYFIDYYTALFH